MFLESERHGHPMLILDDVGVTTSAPAFDRDAHVRRMSSRCAELDARFHLFRTLVVRAIDRGHVAEASARYLMMVLLPYVERARMAHCPDRYDFGPRYLDRDLPDSLRDQIEAWSCWRDLDELRVHVDSVTVAYDALATSSPAAAPAGSDD